MAKIWSAEAVDRGAMYHRPVIHGARLALGATHELEPLIINLFQFVSVKIFVDLVILTDYRGSCDVPF